jgi:DNA polymerase elongation subunit (family B)
VVRAIASIGLTAVSFAFDEIATLICKNWPREHQHYIKSILSKILGHADIANPSDTVDAYIDLHHIRDTLRFKGIKLDVAPKWLTQGYTMQELSEMSSEQLEEMADFDYDPRVPSVSRKASSTTDKSKENKSGKRERPDVESITPSWPEETARLLTQWELRISQELELWQVVRDEKVTRKFVEVWWQLRQDLKRYGDNNDEAVQRMRNFYDARKQFEREFLFREKTRVGKYCIVDAELPLEIRAKKQHMIALMEMSKVSGVPPNLLMEKGETIKVINLFVKWARDNNYVITLRELPSVVFKGGAVLEPMRDFYRTYVATLDFSSLYPSLIQSLLLCYLSLIHPNDLHLYKDRTDLIIAPINIGPPSNQVYYWVRNRRTALPEILATLVRSRSKIKKELETTTDPVMRTILDQRQNSFKLVANATYGFTGYEGSPWPCLPIAVCTTVEGRNAILNTKQMVEQDFGCKVVYGDSVTPTTPVLISYCGREVFYIEIQSIVREDAWQPYDILVSKGQDNEGKEFAIPPAGTMIWSEQGFTPLKYIIRHKTHKRLFRVYTRTGMVTVTEDHSLLRSDATMVRPNELQVQQTSLLHANLPYTLNDDGSGGDMDEDEKQYLKKQERNRDKTELERAELFLMASNLGYQVFIDEETGEVKWKPQNLRDDNTSPVVTKIEEISDAGALGVKGRSRPFLVYDVETENHHFAAGVGRLVVHNTDSVMIIFPGLENMPLENRLPYVFDMAAKAAAHVSKTFVKPMKLLFEKVYFPYLLVAKKRYAGFKYERLDKPPVLDTKGMENVRRDNCAFLRNSLGDSIMTLMKDMDVGKATRCARKAFEQLANQSVKWEDLIVTKTLAEDYKTESHVHLQVAKYLEQHYPLLAPEVGDRVPFVIIKLPEENRATKAYTKGYNPELALRDHKEIDWAHYCYNQIKKPLDRVFCVVNGLPFEKGKKKQATDYLWQPYLDIIDANDKVQKGRVSGNTNIKQHYQKRARTISTDGNDVNANDEDEDDAEGKEVVEKKKGPDVQEVPAPPPPKVTGMANGNLKDMFAKMRKGRSAPL